MLKDGQFALREAKPAEPLTFDSGKCIGCNRCLEACQIDVLVPSQKRDAHPVVAFPDECWYCGSCVMECPTGAIHLRHPLMNQARWVEKSSLARKAGK